MAAEPLGIKTEFLRSTFLDAAPPVLLISEISPTLGNALEFLFVMPVLRLVPTPDSEIPEFCAFSCLEPKPFLLLVEDDPPPADFLYPFPAPFLPAGFFASRRKLEKSSLFSSSSS